MFSVHLWIDWLEQEQSTHEENVKNVLKIFPVYSPQNTKQKSGNFLTYRFSIGGEV